MKRKADQEAVAALIADLTRAMVDRPELVSLNVVTGTTITMLEVSVAAGDTRMVVGRGGRSASALRQILFAVGGRNRTRYTLEVLEPDKTAGRVEVTQEGHASISTERLNAPLHDFDHDPIATTGDLLERVTRELVDHADLVRVQALVGTQAVVFEIHVDQRDVPRVLGRGGRTIDALREILRNLGKKAGRNFIVELVEPVEKVG